MQTHIDVRKDHGLTAQDTGSASIKANNVCRSASIKANNACVCVCVFCVGLVRTSKHASMHVKMMQDGKGIVEIPVASKHHVADAHIAALLTQGTCACGRV